MMEVQRGSLGDPVEAARRTFRRIAHAFPQLRCTIDEEPADTTDLTMDIPEQLGLDFDVHLNLQNVDELRLVAGALWVEWFPCTQEGKADDFFDAVAGLLSGNYRIVERRRGRRPVRALLQRPEDRGWVTIASWRTLSLPWPKMTTTVLQNRPQSRAG